MISLSISLESYSFQAVDELNGSEIDSKTVYVGRAQKKNERQAELKDKFDRLKMERINRYQGINLYVKNLDDDFDDERLRTEFAKFGTITSARVRMPPYSIETGVSYSH